MADNCPECSAVWNGGTCRKCGWEPHRQQAEKLPPAYREFEGRVLKREAPAPETVEEINKLHARLGIARKFGEPFPEAPKEPTPLDRAEHERRKLAALETIGKAP